MNGRDERLVKERSGLERSGLERRKWVNCNVIN
jgi:hypothetical protein